MDTCNYQQVNSNDAINNTNEVKRTIFQKPLLRQMLVSSGLWMVYFLTGLITGAPTVLIPQIRREANSTEAVSEEMASWLSSVLGIAGLPWVFVLPILMYAIGRKYSFAVVSLATTVGYIFFYWSSTVNYILISEIVLGVLTTSAFTLSPAILTEYSSPKYRGVFLTIKSATVFWGMWVSNAIGTFYHWKTIGLLAIICCGYTTTLFFWPDSPYWLATKGRFEECKKAHRWLKGTERDAEIELETIINFQQEYLKEREGKTELFSDESVVKIYKSVISPEFYKPLVLCLLLFLLYYSSGKLICSLYAIDVFEKITANEKTAYKIMLILDGVTVFSMYVGCALSKYLSRRILLFTSSCAGILFLFIMSLYFYLVSLEILSENNYVSISLLVLYTLSLSVGPIILCTTLHGEIVPMRYKSSILMVTGLCLSLLFTMYLKLAPALFRSAGIHGAFLFYGLCSCVCVLLLYKYLPETKDKTLQEIEDHLRSNSRQLPEGRELITIKTYDIK